MELFDAARDARADIADALAAAKTDRKDVLLVFGARWCPDCTALERFADDADVRTVLDERYHVVSVSVGEARGQRDQNADVEADYNHPIAGGIPSVSVLNPEGKIRFDSADGEFSHARAMSPADLLTFLEADRT